MDVKHEVKKAIDDTKDAAQEAKHRTLADAEQMKRDVAGGEMTTREKVGSVVNQKTNEVQADIDKTKREIRDKS